VPFGGGPQKVGPRDLSEDEFKALVDAGSAEGALDARERRLIHKVFEFADKTIAQAMQPRHELFALSYELPLARLIREISERGFSRVPVYSGAKDNVIGILHAKDLVIQGSGVGSPRKLSEILHEPLFVPPTTPVELMFRIFKQRKTHMALVVNEYGKLIGLITMEDLLEELFGEIRDERERKKARALANPLETNPVPRIDEREVAGD
jgi:putative hemolysin